MAAKTANVMARVEPSVKEQAEEIMEMLGIPVSVVINTLYKQIIMTRSIHHRALVLFYTRLFLLEIGRAHV